SACQGGTPAAISEMIYCWFGLDHFVRVLHRKAEEVTIEQVAGATSRSRWLFGREPAGYTHYGQMLHRWTSTGILQWVRTFSVSLPRTIAEMPWRPCEAMTIRSQPFHSAVSMIAWYGCSCSTWTVSHATPAACATREAAARVLSACCLMRTLY